MRKILLSIVTVFGLLLFTSHNVQAATCELTDPVNGYVEFTCHNAELNMSGNGTRKLPLPSTLQPNTSLAANWVEPFSGNTWLESWDSANQTSHFWRQIGGVWTNVPENAILQEIGPNPYAMLRVKNVGGGQRAWAIMQMNDLMLWNGGN